MLTLPELATIDLLVGPPADVDGAPWSVRLLRQMPGSSATTIATRVVAEGKTGAAGQWKKGGIDAGRYEVQVVARGGEVVASEEIEAAGPSQLVNLLVERVAVKGSIRAGCEPLAAKLLFESRGRRVEAATDDRGVYTITLPRDGDWKVSVSPTKSSGMLRGRSLTVHRRSGEEYANGDLDLPGGRLEGEVVDERGTGVAANLYVRRPDGQVAALGASRGDGTFEIVGIEPGDVVVTASGADADSERVSARVPDGDAVTIRVPLAHTRKFPLTIVTTEGAPVAGAAVSYVLPSAGRLEAISSPSGRVELEAGATASAIDVVVTAPGLPVKVVSLPIVDGRFANPTLVLSDAGGTLVVQLHGIWPMVAHGGSGFVALPAFSTAGGMQGSLTRRGFVALVEPGRYTFCPVDGRAPCIEAQVAAGQETFVDLDSFRTAGE